MFNSNEKKIAKELRESTNIIGKGTTLEGNLHTSGNLRIEGKVIGSIQTKAKAVLGDTSVIEGNITAQHAEISGEIQGTIRVAGLLTLKPTASVNGDIITSKLVFEEGAKFNGKCNMGGPVRAKNLVPPQDKPIIKNHQSPEKDVSKASLS